MKRTITIIGALVLVAVLGLGITGCSSPMGWGGHGWGNGHHY